MTAIAVWNSLVDENDYLMNRWTEFLNARCWDIRSSKLPLHQIRYAELALGSNLHALEGSFEWLAPHVEFDAAEACWSECPNIRR